MEGYRAMTLNSDGHICPDKRASIREDLIECHQFVQDERKAGRIDDQSAAWLLKKFLSMELCVNLHHDVERQITKGEQT